MPRGLRGVGKTVLLNRFMAVAEQERVVVSFLEAPESQDFRVLLAGRLRRVLLGLERSGVSSAIHRALKVLKSFSYQLPDGSSVTLDVTPEAGQADSGVLVDDVTDLLVAVGEEVRDRRSGLLLAVDDVHYLSPEEFSALITAIHRTTQLDLPVILVGAGLPQLPGLAGQAKSYSERLFDSPAIGPLSRPDAAAALQIPAAEQGVDIDDDAAAAMVDASKAYPYFLQEWGYASWNAAAGPRITLLDVHAATPMVLDQLDRSFFRVRLDRLTPAERSYLHAMADLGPGPHRSGEIASALGVRVETVAPRRSALIGKGMVYSPAHGDTAFTVPLFDGFLRRVRTP